MKSKEAVACVKSLLAENSPESHRFIEKSVKTLAAGIDEESSAFNLFEFGLRSEAPTRLQINHIQGYPNADAKTERLLVQKKILAIAKVIRAANQNRGSNFALDAMNAIMGVFQKNRSAYSRVLFSFETESSTGKPMKMTLYGRLDSKRQAEEICAALDLKGASSLARFISPNLCNIGIDFGPDKSAKLKVYRWWPLTPTDIKDKTLRSFLGFLHAAFPLRDFGTMLRLRSNGRPEPSLKWGITFRHPTTVGDIAQLKQLHDHFPQFLDRASRHLTNHHVSYLGFDPGSMSIYCGKGIDAWLPWLRRSDD